MVLKTQVSEYFLNIVQYAHSSTIIACDTEKGSTLEELRKEVKRLAIQVHGDKAIGRGRVPQEGQWTKRTE